MRHCKELAQLVLLFCGMRLPFTSTIAPLLLLGCGLSMNPDLPSAKESGDSSSDGGGWTDYGDGWTDGDINLGGDGDAGPGDPASGPNEGLGGAAPCDTTTGAAAAGAAGASQICQVDR